MDRVNERTYFEARNLRQLNSQYLLRIRYVHTVLAYMEILV